MKLPRYMKIVKEDFEPTKEDPSVGRFTVTIRIAWWGLFIIFTKYVVRKLMGLWHVQL